MMNQTIHPYIEVGAPWATATIHTSGPVKVTKSPVPPPHAGLWEECAERTRRTFSKVLRQSSLLTRLFFFFKVRNTWGIFLCMSSQRFSDLGNNERSQCLTVAEELLSEKAPTPLISRNPLVCSL